ncbi:hypothetical protein P8631_00750 [Guyparkeria sp. 1SP6A2]|nr:hypothetical protein [Guyparkeria sp. 1SP6A2]
MTDAIDRARELEERARADALADMANQAQEGPKATGYCLNCEAPIDPPRRWCDVECRDELERYA